MEAQGSDSPDRSSRATAAGGESPSRAGIPPSLEPLLQEYEFERVDLEGNAVTIIERTLEYGNRAEVRWVLTTYGVDRVRDVVRSRGARHLSPRSFNFWRLILDIEVWRPHPWPEAARALWNPGG